MSTDRGFLEPSPFDEDAPSVSHPKPWEPSRPMSEHDLNIWLSMPVETRVYDAYRCMWNLMAEDGIGLGSGVVKQCRTRIADPTRSRYCSEHATTLGVEFFAPGEQSELVHGEVAANLTRLVPKAVRTLELVMDDTDAPPGIRAKAADSVLDRTGYGKGIDVRVDAQVAVVDVSSVISERLSALREAKLKELGLTPTGEPDPTPDPPPVPAHVRGTPGVRPHTPAPPGPIRTVPVPPDVIAGEVVHDDPFTATSFADDPITPDLPTDPDLPVEPVSGDPLL